MQLTLDQSSNVFPSTTSGGWKHSLVSVAVLDCRSSHVWVATSRQWKQPHYINSVALGEVLTSIQPSDDDDDDDGHDDSDDDDDSQAAMAMMMMMMMMNALMMKMVPSTPLRSKRGKSRFDDLGVVSFQAE